MNVGLIFGGRSVELQVSITSARTVARGLAAAGLPVVDYEATTRADFEADPQAFLARLERLPLPLFVKPSVGGSSVGVKRVDSRACQETSIRFALQFDDAVLVERGVKGRELE